MYYSRFFLLLLLVIGCNQEVENPTVNKPSNLLYEISQIGIKMGASFTSVIPVVEGNAPLLFSIEKIADKITGDAISDITAFSINSETGVVSLVENNDIGIGSYSIDVSVSNGGGASSFKGALILNILELAVPKNLAYNPNNISVEEGDNFLGVEPTVEGVAPFVYTIKNTAAIGSFISLNSTTGEISIDGTTSIIGEYKLDIEVSNTDGTSLFNSIYTIVIEQHVVNVPNGFYVTEVNTDPIMINALLSESVEADGFSYQNRAGFYSNYVYLNANDYVIVEVENNFIINSYGGASTSIGITADCGPQAYTLISSTVDGTVFSALDGLYKISYDGILDEIILFEIEQVGIVGSSLENGWASSMQLELQGTISADGGSWQSSNILFLEGQFRVKLNCRWNIDRRIDNSLGFSESNGYAMFTNFGGSPSNLENGNDGANIEVAFKGGSAPDEGYYTVKVDWSASNGFTMDMQRTGDFVPPSFDPNNYQWGIIGAALTSGWDSDINLSYVGISGSTHSWSGTFGLTNDGTDGSGEFKFRTNDSWDLNLGFNDATKTGDVADITEAGGNFKVGATSNYTITISTGDDGSSWNIDFVKN